MEKEEANIIKTIILPGYSFKNKLWAEEVREKVRINGEIIIHEWRHWSSEGIEFSFGEEIKKIIQEIGGEKVNIIAKSIGVQTALQLMPKIKNQVNKVILNGFASVEEEVVKGLRQTLLSIRPSNILVFQNTNDPYANYAEVENMVHSVEPKLKIIEKPADTHSYPYYEEFEAFLE